MPHPVVAWSFRLFSALLLLSSNVRAEADCAPYRLDKDGGPFTHIPVQSQGDLGLCYAYAAAQLVDYYRFSTVPPKGDRKYEHTTSPLHGVFSKAALRGWGERLSKGDTEAEKLFSKIEGGTICGAVEWWSGSQSCDKDSVLDRYSGSKPGVRRYLKSRYYELKLGRPLARGELDELVAKEAPHEKESVLTREVIDAFLEYRRIYSDKESFTDRIFGASKELQAQRDRLSNGVCRLYSQLEFPSGLVPLQKELAGLIAGDNEVAYLEKTLMGACKDPRNLVPVPKLSCESECSHSMDPEIASILGRYLGIPCPAENFRSMVAKLRAGADAKEAVGIGYCGDMIAKGARYRSFHKQPDCGPHASILIGREMRKFTRGGKVLEKCQYLIRNSWGTSCNRYHSDWTCEGGNFWVDRDSLEDGLLDVNRIRGPG